MVLPGCFLPDWKPLVLSTTHAFCDVMARGRHPTLTLQGWQSRGMLRNNQPNRMVTRMCIRIWYRTSYVTLRANMFSLHLQLVFYRANIICVPQSAVVSNPSVSRTRRATSTAPRQHFQPLKFPYIDGKGRGRMRTSGLEGLLILMKKQDDGSGKTCAEKEARRLEQAVELVQIICTPHSGSSHPKWITFVRSHLCLKSHTKARVHRIQEIAIAVGVSKIV